MTYSWTTNDGENKTYHFDPNAVPLSLGDTYLFEITTENATTIFSAWQDSTQVFSLIAPTGGDHLVLSPTYSRGLNYANYEEIVEYLKDSGAPKEIFEGLKRINSLSINDSLTRIPNRGYLECRIEEEIANVGRHNTDLSAILIDIDYFKKINDTYGHSAGDEVLKNLSDYLKDAQRKGDVVGRYGGEEFLILLPHTAKEDAFKVAERIREDAGTHPCINGN